jgi:hypothetical protein
MKSYLRHFLSFCKGFGVLLAIVLMYASVAGMLIFLGGGFGTGIFDLVYPLWPILIIPLAVMSAVEGHLFRRGYLKRGFSFGETASWLDGYWVGPITVTALVVVFLPIILNGAAHLLWALDYSATANMAFAIRWVAPMLIIIGLPLLTMLAAVVVKSITWLAKKAGGTNPSFIFT